MDSGRMKQTATLTAQQVSLDARGLQARACEFAATRTWTAQPEVNQSEPTGRARFPWDGGQAKTGTAAEYARRSPRPCFSARQPSQFSGSTAKS
jgi:hypothetical protein